jgi:hypothetical protein
MNSGNCVDIETSDWAIRGWLEHSKESLYIKIINNLNNKIKFIYA